ncbi:MAG: 3',5'-cyclic-nucleotide phosphodiesterase [Deltaproteobacteria bacterium]|nr:3',5'-cyclic-nucleotide phosphodiesterase [Deltaproteobacteria bacterium]
MQIKVLGCYGAELPGFKTSCFMLNDSTLIDAGAVTSILTPHEQRGIRDILVTHSHLDHIKDIPLLADNIIGSNPGRINVISSGEVIAILKEHLFNNSIWPDFSKIPTPENPVINFKEIEVGKPFQINGTTVTAIKLNHVVPTLGYIFTENGSSVAILGDTRDTEEIWQALSKTDNLKGIFIETSFPDSMVELAQLSGHLTPKMLASELGKLKGKADTCIYVYHMKPNYLDTLKEEIRAIKNSNISILELNQTFIF